MVKLICCTDLIGNIGKDNNLLYNIPEDMKFFREMTKGHVVIMGDKTWDSLPFKPLPNRHNVVVSLDEEVLQNIQNNCLDVETNNDLFDAIDKYSYNDLFIIGGASIYNQVINMDLVDEAYVTIVYEFNGEADVWVDLIKLFEQLPKHEILKRIIYDNKTVIFWKFSK